MSLVIERPGILSTIQDGGRMGFFSLGINPNGAMDRTAMRLANTLVGNDAGEAVIEMHFPAPKIVFEQPCSFSIAGADFGACLNDQPMANWSSNPARTGDVLCFHEPRYGTRAYLALAGGLEIPYWLGSKSTNLAVSAGGFEGRKLTAGDRIDLARPRVLSGLTIGPSLIPKYSRFPTVRVIPGGEFELLSAVSERTFLNEGFRVTSNSDRMGSRLDGEPLFLLHDKPMVSAPVTFGTIQLLPDGQLVILLADHQTSGGYPRIGTVISADLPLLAQLGPGDGVGFHLCSVEESIRLTERFERELCFLRSGVKLSR
ncbi:MAG: biotin-dependent carboxyltransferase family protein [Pyrinomonadaceae bacterium]